MPLPKLTTTSYALLGLLDMQPFSAYELTRYMRRSALAILWPRTEASIYREPKVLEAHGLAASRVEATGARKRSVYRITDDGRAVLRNWLAEPGRLFAFESEAAVKAFLASAGTLDDLRTQLRQLAGQPYGGATHQTRPLDDLEAGRVQFPERLHFSAMAADLISRVNIAVRDWADHWLANTEEWTTTAMDAGIERQARAELRRIRRTLQRRGGPHRGPTVSS